MREVFGISKGADYKCQNHKSHITQYCSQYEGRAYRCRYTFLKRGVRVPLSLYFFFPIL